MTLQKITALPTVAISTSESPDMAALGLSEAHLRDAMAALAVQLLSSGTSLAYGGDLRVHGFTELLFDLVARYRGHPHHTGEITVTDYLAWPVHIRMTTAALTAFSAGHEGSAELIFLARDGTPLAQERWLELPRQEPDEAEWTEGLTTMRVVMRDTTQARIVLGGRVTGYKGRLPGIAEETLLSLEAQQPLFLLGGFGGCTRDIAETMGLVDPWVGSRSHWDGRPSFERYAPNDLHNGLSDEENAVLARTPHIQQAVTLVSRGLRRILKTPTGIGPTGGSSAQGLH